MLSCQKHKFDLADDIHYLNCAYMSPLLNGQEQVAMDILHQLKSPNRIKVDDFFNPVQALKEAFAKMIHCEEVDRIAVIPAASYGIASVAKNVPLKAGQHIVMVDEQFPSNFYTWDRLAKEKGANMRIVKAPEGHEKSVAWNQAILEAIDEQTALVSIGHIHWADGTVYDLQAIREKTRAVGALLVIDGTQSVGALPIDVSTLQPDAIICGGYKWLFAPYGLSVGYFGPAFDHGIPIEENWINRRQSEDFSGLVKYESTYKPLAHRYSMGEQSNFLLVPMTLAGIQQVLDWGVGHIQSYCENLFNDHLDNFRDLGCLLEAEAHRCKHLFGIGLGDAFDKEAIRAACQKHKVSVSVRGDFIRVSPHVYNEEEDVLALLKCFKEAKKQEVYSV